MPNFANRFDTHARGSRRGSGHAVRASVLAALAGATLAACVPCAAATSNAAAPANAASPASTAMPASRSQQAAVLANGCDALVHGVDAVGGNGPVFLQSYEAAASRPLPPALQNAAFVYDNALATIALVACGKPAEARRIADALALGVAHDRHYRDGRLRNAYRAGAALHDPLDLPGWWDASANRWDEDAYQVGSATGNVACAALALLTMYDATSERRYLDAAASAMKWVIAATYDAGPPGGFTGGYFGEEPQPLKQSWKSTEQNVDAYAAFNWLARATGNSAWVVQAARARDFIAAMWDPRQGRFAIGTLPDGRTLNAGPSGLDAELWPLIALPVRASGGWSRSLDWTLQHHRAGAGLGFNAQPDGVWTEGTAQAALVLQAYGRDAEAAPFWNLLLAQRAPSGMLYATPNARISTGLSIGPTSKTPDFYYFHLPHLGATAWSVLAAAGWNPFAGRRLGAPFGGAF